jgi:serine/threonine protein kinase
MVAGKLEHPGVVRVYDVGVFDGTYYLVMEFVEGEPLANLIE